MESKSFFFKSKTLNKNISRTKKIFSNLKLELNNQNLPILQSYNKNFELGFSKKLVKKYSKYKNIFIIGMGGSILGTKSIFSFFKKKIKKNVYFFDNLDDNLYFQFKKIKNIKNSCFIVVSKSGNTLETFVNFNFIFSKISLKNRLIFISEVKDSVLVNLAKKYNAEIIEHKNFIGGRYSVLSEVGMFPAALMGLNIKKFKNLKNFIKSKNFSSSLVKNVATIYTLNTLGIRNSVILNYDTNLIDLACWYQQLVGESLGKKGKGITPILSQGPKDHHSLLQLYLEGPKDKFFTFFNFSRKEKNKHKILTSITQNNTRYLKGKNLDTIIRAQSHAVQNVFLKKKIQFRQFDFYEKNENELGKIFSFFVLETILLARLMSVNPFNQPAVEEVKVETKKILLR